MKRRSDPRPSPFDKLRTRKDNGRWPNFLILSLSPAFALCAMADKKDKDRDEHD